MTGYQHNTDAELIEKMQQEDAFAFSELYERYAAMLLQHATSVLSLRADAEDVVHDVFANIWTKSKEIHIHTSVKSYLFTALRNNMLNRLQRSKVIDNYLDALQKHLDQQSGLSPDEQLYEKDTRIRINTSLEKLPRKMREVFVLSRVHEYSYKEISEKLNISNDTVKSHIKNALKILRKGFQYFI